MDIRIAVEAELRGDKVEVRIRDDGRGIDVQNVAPHHLGLKIMRARAEAIGADAYCRDAAVAVETAKEFVFRRHNQRIASAGFSSCDVWFQCFNFASWLAIK